MDLLIRNIDCLVQVEDSPALFLAGRDMQKVRVLKDAYIIIDKGLIFDFGLMSSLGENRIARQVLDASGKYLFPSFCDSHTHLVYSGSRETEFVDRIRGLSYARIAENGGGILNSAKKLEAASEDQLFREASLRVNEIISMGTGAVEIKSGYGLTPEAELKMLRVIRRIRDSFPLEVKSTFLGAHALPAEFRNRRRDYVDLVINRMIPEVVAEDLADFIDVFCDTGFFSVEETDRILMAGMKHGLRAKLHANELGFSGGVQVGVKNNALSVDHLEHSGDDEIETLLDSETMPVLLPGSVFFLGLPNPPIRKMIDAGLPVALASDYNPGSSPSGNMKFIMSLGCIKHGMLPEEALNAVTVNAAYAMGISETHGSIAKGKVANLFLTKEIPSMEFLPYAFGSNLVDTVILKGTVIDKSPAP